MSALVERWALRWDEFWFAPEGPVTLGLLRILAAGTGLWILLSRDLPALSGVPPAFWASTARSFEWRYLLFPGHETLERALQGLAIVALMATMAGVGVRVFALIAAILLIHLTPIESFQWYSSAFTLSIPIFGLLFAAASPSADAWSLLARRPRPAPHWQYRWPVQAMRVQLALLYFFSGYSKLMETGLAWASPTHLQAWVLGMYQREHPVFTTLPALVGAHPWMSGVMGIVALLIEFGYPLALFSRRARYTLLVLTIVMHTGILLVLNITIMYFPLLLVFVDWDDLAARRRGDR